MEMQVEDRLWFPIDVSSVEEARALYEPLAAFVPNVKVGLEFITNVGVPAALKCMRDLGAKKTWLDGKFDDIPNTVAGASKAAASHGVDIFNVHSCGEEAIKKAVKNKGASKVLVVTLLTSLEIKDLKRLGYYLNSQQEVWELVRMRAVIALEAGADGIVCSPQELKYLAQYNELAALEKYTPGIRDEDSPPDDQKRTMSAYEAILAGATALVVGRPISDPKTRGNKTAKQAVELIYEKIIAALAARNTN